MALGGHLEQFRTRLCQHAVIDCSVLPPRIVVPAHAFADLLKKQSKAIFPDDWVEAKDLEAWRPDLATGELMDRIGHDSIECCAL